MVRLYWEIGRHIVEYEQGGSDRAQYGARLLEHLSADLTQRYGRGFSATNLKYMRMLYEAFSIRQALPDELSWTHLLLVLRVEEPLAREFYVKQCQRERWSTRELERQINSLLFERRALFCCNRLFINHEHRPMFPKGDVRWHLRRECAVCGDSGNCLNGSHRLPSNSRKKYGSTGAPKQVMLIDIYRC